MPDRTSARALVTDALSPRRLDVVRGIRSVEAIPADTPFLAPSAAVRPFDPDAAAPAPADVPIKTTFASTLTASWTPEVAPASSAAVEQYRRAVGTLIQAQTSHGIKVVMVASAMPGEGKSLTAANLAVTLCKSYRRNTLLIDADLRLPMLHKVFRVDNSRGLNDHLDPRGDGSITTIQVYPLLTLLPAGRPTTDPVGGLTSARMEKLVADAASSFDWVIIDTPPVTLLPDANLLASMADAVLLVIAAGSTQHEYIAHAVEMLGRDRILGVILNRVDDDVVSRYGYSKY